MWLVELAGPALRAANRPDVGIGGEIDQLLLMQASVEVIGGVGLERDGAVVADDIGHDGAGHQRGREEGGDVDRDVAVGIDFAGVYESSEGA